MLYWCALFFLLNSAIRIFFLFEASVINEDSALINGSLGILQAGTIPQLFISSYGPRVIRPFQLIGMALEYRLWGDKYLLSFLTSFGLLSISQSILVQTFRQLRLTEMGVFAALCIGCSVLTSEPVLWLSDRHDLYLLLFLTLALFLMVRIINQVSSLQRNLLCLFFCFWGQFYSNEKGTILPLLITLAAITIPLLQRRRIDRTLVKRLGALALTAGFATCGYFILRYLVLGMLIGGYDNQVLPSQGLDYATTTALLKTLAYLSFWPRADGVLGSSSPLQLFVLVIALGALLLEGLRGNRSNRVLVVSLLLFVVLLLLSSLPTFKYIAVPHLGGLLNTRFRWLPHLVTSIFIGLLFGAWYRASPHRWIPISLLILFFSLRCIGVARASQSIIEAHRLTSEARTIFEHHCACVQQQDPQTRGLPPLWGGANTFTESIWLDEHLRLKGYPECTSREQRCDIEFQHTVLGFQFVPWKVSPLTIAQTIRSKTRLPDAVYKVKYHRESPLPRVMTEPLLWIAGWGYEEDTGAPLSRLVLEVNGEILSVSTPNIRSYKPFSSNAEHGFYNFSIPLARERLQLGNNSVALFAVKESLSSYVLSAPLGESTVIRVE